MITKVYGGAGCGKTHFLTNLITKHIGNGTHPRNICMITLTRNARDEFVKRVKDSTSTTDENMKWFSTMHSVAGKLLNKSTDWINSADRKMFVDGFGSSVSEVRAIQQFDDARRNCVLPATDEGIEATTTATGVDKWYKTGYKGGAHITNDGIIQYATDWSIYMEDIGKYDFVRAISECTTLLNDGSIEIPFTHLFVDEFQDFSPLQYKLYQAIAAQTEDSWICGDDRQCIYRFAGSSPVFLQNTEADYIIDLPKTYRFGSAIDVNALKYVDGMSTTHSRSIETADHESKVSLLRGDEWIQHVGRDPGDTVYLVRKASDITVISTVLNRLGVRNSNIGKSRGLVTNPEKLYKTILLLEFGMDVPGDDIKRLISSLPASVNHEQYLQRGIKTNVDMRVVEPYYNATEFCDELMTTNEWDGQSITDNAKGVADFIKENDTMFPDPLRTETKHFVGTIHSFKGNEADNVFLFAQVPYPFSKDLSPRAVDEELRTFYVGSTRARYNLYEVSDYLFDGNGSLAMNAEELL